MAKYDFLGSTSLTELVTNIKGEFDKLKKVAYSGSYNDLDNKPVLFEQDGEIDEESE